MAFWARFSSRPAAGHGYPFALGWTAGPTLLTVVIAVILADFQYGGTENPPRSSSGALRKRTYPLARAARPLPARRKTLATMPGDRSRNGESIMFATCMKALPRAGSTEAAAR